MPKQVFLLIMYRKKKIIISNEYDIEKLEEALEMFYANKKNDYDEITLSLVELTQKRRTTIIKKYVKEN